MPTIPTDAPPWFLGWARDVEQQLERLRAPDTVPKAKLAKGRRGGQTVYVPDATGGPCNAYWDPAAGVWRINQSTVVS